MIRGGGGGGKYVFHKHSKQWHNEQKVGGGAKADENINCVNNMRERAPQKRDKFMSREVIFLH